VNQPETPAGKPVGVTAPQGFAAASGTAGLKSSAAPDLALVHNLGPRFDAAAVFTSNTVVAAPVQWTRQVVKDGQLKAVILNSGGANACTGPDGFADTHATAEAVATALGIGAIDVAVCSTGIIGQRLPIDKIIHAVPALQASETLDAGAAAAAAIMTTDTFAKQAGYQGDGWSVGGMAKGAAMLSPALATMLAVITTDAVADAATLDQALRSAVRTTFDRVDTDGCMSTNDTVLLLASGASGVSAEPAELAEAVRSVCDTLAAAMAEDAEGAAHVITVTVTGAASDDDALIAARAIARNALFKCAIFGNDPYWGRVLAAAGATDVVFDPDATTVAFNGVTVCRGGIAVPGASVDIHDRQVDVVADLGAGSGTATVRTTDLTYDYVRLNAEYPT